jgi:hypothetical protein
MRKFDIPSPRGKGSSCLFLKGLHVSMSLRRDAFFTEGESSEDGEAEKGERRERERRISLHARGGDAVHVLFSRCIKKYRGGLENFGTPDRKRYSNAQIYSSRICIRRGRFEFNQRFPLLLRNTETGVETEREPDARAEATRFARSVHEEKTGVKPLFNSVARITQVKIYTIENLSQNAPFCGFYAKTPLWSPPAGGILPEPVFPC